MKAAIVTIGDVTGKSQNLPDRKIIKEAQRNTCISAAFWVKIKAGKIPYVFNKEQNELVEATYNETMANLRGMRTGEIYWLADEDVSKVADTLKEIADIDKSIDKYK